MTDAAPPLPTVATRRLADVIPALLTALGTPLHPPGPVDWALPPVRAAAVLLIDGLGAELLAAHAAHAPFLAGLADAGPLTVGFPSSTSTSLVTLGTGRCSGEHGLLGIRLRVSDRDVLDTLGWIAPADRSDQRERWPPEQVQPVPTLFERAAAAGVHTVAVGPRAFDGSGLTRASTRGVHYRGAFAVGDLAADTLDALTGPGPRLVHAYHPDLDLLGHLHGPGSTAWRLQLALLDRVVTEIADRLPSDALLVVTGDHGMVTVDRRLDADTHPDLRAGVAELTGDGRARHVHTAPGAREDVLATWRAVLGDDAWVVPGEQAVADGWFGPVDPRWRSRIGDVVVACRGGTAIVRSQAEPLTAGLIGLHGSFTPAEQQVPLLVAGSD